MADLSTRSYVRPREVRLRRFMRKRTGPKVVWARWFWWERRSKRVPRPTELLVFRCPQYREAFAHG